MIIMKWYSRRTQSNFVNLVLISLFLCQTTFGTVIYVRVTPQEIVIAADSKRTVMKPDGKAVFVATCKIIEVEDKFFVSAGIGGYTHSNFDVQQVAKQALNGDGNLLKSVQTFHDLIREPLTRTLEIIRSREPSRYKTILKSAAIQSIFAHSDKKFPLVVISQILVEEINGKIELKFNIFTCPGDCQLPVTYSVGSSRRAEALDTNNFWDRGSVNGIRELIKIAIADNEQDSGEPIDVLQITKTGAIWIQRQPNCKQQEFGAKEKKIVNESNNEKKDLANEPSKPPEARQYYLLFIVIGLIAVATFVIWIWSRR